MCSFLLLASLLPEATLKKLNRILKYRGPDFTNTVFINGFSIIHNLLNITGQVQPQPFFEDNIVCIFNGEIYNYKEFGNFTSDGQCLIPLYQKYGEAFTKYLDGEFAVVLIDFQKQISIIATDTFRTKPLFYALQPYFGASTFSQPLKDASLLDITPAEPNTTLVIDLKTNTILNRFQTFEFDIRQYKNSYDDWISAFEKSVFKRATVTNTKPYICLSSGYDSGGICCALQTLGLEYSIYSIPANEHRGILAQREAFISPQEINIVDIDSNEILGIRQDIQDSTEDFTYKIWESGNWNKFSLYEDNATLGIAKICSLAKQSGNRVYLSGSGADEIMSDYAINGVPVFSHSCFSGVFPHQLQTIFPSSPDSDCIWKSFYKSTQEAYLMKEEYIGGSYGIEGRYPYLDKQVVQEFLWLTPELKNRTYKAPLEYYLEKQNFPFEKQVKRGFSPV